MATIFVIDDNSDVLNVTLSMLSKKGYEAVGATNGLDAIQMLRKVNPDLIITDVIMPQMNGYKLLKELKSNPLTAAIPVLVISGHGQMAESFSGMGVKGFLTKPFTLKELVAKIREILKPQEEDDSEEEAENGD